MTRSPFHSLITHGYARNSQDATYKDEARAEQVLNAAESRQLAQRAVQRSVILLRNEKNLLPLDKTGKAPTSMAVIGPLADPQEDLLDMWGFLTKPGPVVSILQGIRNKVGSAVRVEYAHGPNLRRLFRSQF